jgi:4-hydroxythreonine-4-phosphate dehydrogenase
MSHNKPVVLTPGEPSGIGPEIAAKAWSRIHGEPKTSLALIYDVSALRHRLAQAGLNVPVVEIRTLDQVTAAFKTALPVLHRPLPHVPHAGAFHSDNSPWVIKAIEEAVDLCLAGDASAMVTNPIQKEALYAAGFKHQGHTDFLAALARRKGHDANDVMMLVGGGLRAVPVTVHIALKDVASQLHQKDIETQARVVHASLQSHFGIASPRIAISGLNPHAGENGTMGREEIDVIMPAIKELRAEGMNVVGPLPADTAFFPDARKTYDAILCMYHDQALIPVKTLDFHGGVNVTLGLPFIRTSPDHGTALNLAGTGKAQAESLIAAIHLAVDMAQRASSNAK